MLVLSRKVGEKLIIGDNITVVVNRVAGNRVTLGIEAPPEVRVIRGELRKAHEDALATSKAPLADVARSASNFDVRSDAKDASLLRLAK
jgi:carbon storage regulator